MVRSTIRLNDTLEANCNSSADFFEGEIFHVQCPGAHFGTEYTPIARYFATRPVFAEGFHDHWSLHCFFRIHELSPEPMDAGDLLVKALIALGVCFEPIYLTVHSSQSLGGTPYGQVFDLS
jgi:hypothetical protein